MTWGRIDDAAPNHPKFLHAGPLAFGFFWAGVCYANRYGTNGVIPDAAVSTILPGLARAAGARCAEALVTAGLWERRDAGYLIHDFLEYNPSAAEVMEQRRLHHARNVAGGRARSVTAARIEGRFVSQPIHQPVDQPYASQTAVQAHQPDTSTRSDPIRSVPEEPRTTLSGVSPDDSHSDNGRSAHRTDALEILAWLNKKAGTRYEPVEANLRLIVARLKEADRPAWRLKQLVSTKAAEWPIGHDLRKYLRPSTLFNREKCAQYLGQLPPPREEITP